MTGCRLDRGADYPLAAAARQAADYPLAAGQGGGLPPCCYCAGDRLATVTAKGHACPVLWSSSSPGGGSGEEEGGSLSEDINWNWVSGEYTGCARKRLLTNRLRNAEVSSVCFVISLREMRFERFDEMMISNMKKMSSGHRALKNSGSQPMYDNPLTRYAPRRYLEMID